MTREYPSLLNAVAAGAAYFAAIFALGFLLGVGRTALLAANPALDRTTGVLIELPLMLAASWFACRWLALRFAVSPQMPQRVLMGAVAFALLMLAELSVGAVLSDRTVAEHFALYRQPSYLAGLIGQVAFALIPLAQMLLLRAKAGGPPPSSR